MSQAAEINEYYLQSTNMDHNVLNDVTRGDLVDIIDEIYRTSKIYKLTDLLDTIVDHTGHYGVIDPHETTSTQLIVSCFESVYSYWLKQGYSGTIGDLKDTVYKYCSRANELMLFLGRTNDNVTSVKVVADYIQNVHNERINNYADIVDFVFSEKTARWSGLLSGVQIRSDDDTNIKAELARLDTELLDFVAIYRRALEGYTLGEEPNDTYEFVRIYEDAFNNIGLGTYVDDPYGWVYIYNAIVGLLDSATVDEVFYYFGDVDVDLVNIYNTALADGLHNLPGFNGIFPDELEVIAPKLYEFVKYYNLQLGNGLDDLPVDISVVIQYGSSDYINDLMNTVNTNIADAYGTADSFLSTPTPSGSMAVQSNAILGSGINSSTDLVDVYNNAFNTGTNQFLDFNTVLPNSSELAGIDRNTTDLTSVYMNYLGDNYTNLPAGSAVWELPEYDENTNISDYYLNYVLDILNEFAGLGLGVFVDGVLDITNLTEEEKLAAILSPKDPWFDKSLVATDDNIKLTIKPFLNGKVWYQWHLSVPKTFDKAVIKIDISATGYGLLQYRLSDVTDEWTPFTGRITVDSDSTVESQILETNEYHDIYEHRYLLPIDIESIITNTSITYDVDTVEYDFRIDFGENSENLIIYDIITTVDARDILKTIDIPHSAKWYEFFSNGAELPIATFSWYSYISILNSDTTVDWFNNTGNFYVAAQLHPNVLVKSDSTFPAITRNSLFKINEDENNYLEIYSICSGRFTEPYPSDTTTMTRLDSVQIGVNACKNGHHTEITTENLRDVNRSIYRFYINYDLYTSKISILCQTSTYVPSFIDNTGDELRYRDDPDVVELLEENPLDVDLVAKYMEALGDGLDNLPAYSGTLPKPTTVIDNDESYLFTLYYNLMFDTDFDTLPANGMNYNLIVEPDAGSKYMYDNKDGSYTFYFDLTAEGFIFAGDSSITPTDWEIQPADLQTQLGVYELVYYPKKIEDSGTIMALIHTNINAVPYLS